MEINKDYLNDLGLPGDIATHVNDICTNAEIEPAVQLVRPHSSLPVSRRVSWARHDGSAASQTSHLRDMISRSADIQHRIKTNGEMCKSNNADKRQTELVINSSGNLLVTPGRRLSVYDNEIGFQPSRRRKTLAAIIQARRGSTNSSTSREREITEEEFEGKSSHPRSRSLGGAFDASRRSSKWRISSLASPITTTPITENIQERIAILVKKLRRYVYCAVRFIRLYSEMRRLQCENPIFSSQMSVIEDSAGVELDKKHDMFFDPSEYKAISQMRMTKSVKHILQTKSELRSHQDIQHVMVALRSIQMIADYPVTMQRMLARGGRFNSCGSGRFLVKQHQDPYCYYIILFGSVIVCVQDEGKMRAQTKCYLHRGESFGELAIVERTSRQSTVITRTYSEFLVVDQDTYESVFLAGGGKNLSDPVHNQFLRSLFVLEDWPLDKLVNDPKIYIFNFFRRGGVIVKNTKNSKWIYIVKSGSVRVLKMLSDVCPETDTHSGGWTVCPPSITIVDPFDSSTGKVDTRNVQFIKSIRTSDRKVASCGKNPSTATLHHRREEKPNTEGAEQEQIPHEKKTLADALENDVAECQVIGKPVFVHIQTLTKGESFGLASVLYSDQPSLCLVSNGAECVLLNKRFYLKHCPSEVLNKLRQQISPYPSDDKLQSDLKIRVTWDAYKEATITQLYDDIRG